MNVQINRVLGGLMVLAASALPFPAVCQGELNVEKSDDRNLPPEKCEFDRVECPCNQQAVGNECVLIHLGGGTTSPGAGFGGGGFPTSLDTYGGGGSDMPFAPESLTANTGYSYHHSGGEALSDGETPKEITLSHPDGEKVTFRFVEGQSVATARKNPLTRSDETLTMVDAAGNPVTKNPVYWDLETEDGAKARFVATNAEGQRGNLVSITDQGGQTVTASEMGVDTIRNADGIRQFLSPSRLSDVQVTTNGYDIAVYAVESVPEKDPDTGLYVLPAAQPVDFLSVRRYDNDRRAVVTLANGSSEPRVYTFVYADNDWSLTKPDGSRSVKTLSMRENVGATRVTKILDPAGACAKAVYKHYGWFDGRYVLTNVTEACAEAVKSTTWTYRTSEPGKGRIATKRDDNRKLTTAFTYDDAGRVVNLRRTAAGLPEETVDYSYEPLVSADRVRPSDSRPRRTVRKIGGVEVERVYKVFTKEQDIVERSAKQGAAYGAADSLRTVRTYWPGGSGISSGRVKSLRYENGRVDTCDYASADGLLTETVTHLHECEMTALHGQTTRDITVRDRRGNITEQRTEAFVEGAWRVISRDRMTYDFRGKEIRREDLAGRVVTTAWDCCNRLSETNPDRTQTSWEYDFDGRVTATSRLLGLSETAVTWVTDCREYDFRGHVVATWTTNRSENVGTPVVRHAYDGFGRIVRTDDPAKGTVLTRYSADGLSVTTVYPKGTAMTVRSNAAGEIVSVTGDADAPAYYTRGVQTDGTRWTMIRTGGVNSPRFEKKYVNLLGQTVREDRSGFNGTVIVAFYTYDQYGNQRTTSVAGRPTTEYAYTDTGRLSTKTIRTDSEWVRTRYLPMFALCNGQVWQTAEEEYDSSDGSIATLSRLFTRRLTGFSGGAWSESKSVDLLGRTTVYREAFENDRLTRTTVRPDRTQPDREVYFLGQPMRRCPSSGVERCRFTDALGREKTYTDASGNLRYLEYDRDGRVAAETDGQGRRRSFGYNAYGECVSVTDAAGHVVNYAYDRRGRFVGKSGATFAVTSEYDDFNEIVARTTYRDGTSAAGETVRYERDAGSGLITARVFANGTRNTYTYDGHGRIASRVWARGVRTDYAYDAWGDLSGIMYSDETPEVMIFRDAVGRLTLTKDAAGVTRFLYNDHGQLIEEQVGSHRIERHYDGDGRYVGYSFDGVRQATFGFDAATGRLATMTALGSETPFTWEYAEGRALVSKLAYPSGHTAEYTRGETGEILSVLNSLGGSPLSLYEYEYDKSLRTTVVRGEGVAVKARYAYDVTYDEVGQLVKAQNRKNAGDVYSCVYDGVGNRVSMNERGTTNAYTVTTGNLYTKIGTFAPEYDADGNQTKVRTSNGDWTVEYNAENRPVRWTRGSTVVTMAYDCRGRRVAKNGRSFFYNGYRQIADSDRNTYVWNPMTETASTPLVFNRRGFVAYYLTDRDHNVREIVYGDQVAAHYDYGPFGKRRYSYGGMEATNPWRFSSEYADDETGTVYYNYRHYNPTDGRWMSRDPYWGSDDPNGYVMCGNRAIGCVDVLGLWGSYWPQNDHSKFTREGVARAAKDVSCLKNNPDLLNQVADAIDAGNHWMDASPEYSQSDDENLPLHYNRNAASGQSAADAQAKYRQGLADRRNKIDEDLNGVQATKEDCMDALQQLGELTHMLQDYYGHGVAWDYSVSAGEPRAKGYNGSRYERQYEMEKEEHGEIGDSFGGPDTPDDDGNPATENHDQMKPSNYSDGDDYTEHGTYLNLTPEPGRKARDKENRMASSVDVTAEEAKKWLEKWCGKCCKKLDPVQDAQQQQDNRNFDGYFETSSRFGIR